MTVPHKWIHVEMKDLGEIFAGRQVSPHFQNGQLRPYLRVANVLDGFIDFSDVKKMPFTDQEFSRYKLRDGDILLTEGQSLELVGRPAVFNRESLGVCFQNTVVRLRPNGRVHGAFTFYLCQFLFKTGRFISIAKKTTSIAHLGVSRFANFATVIPPLPEQRKIAEILGACDAAIEAQERLIVQKQKRKKGLMQQLLTGEVRFPEFVGTGEWKEVRLGQIFKERKEIGRGDLELLAVTGQGGVVRRDGLNRKDTSSEDKSKYKLVCPGDIAYNTMRMWQGVSGLSRYEGIVSPAYTILKPGKEVDPLFASYFFKLPKTISLFHRYSQGLVNDTLNLKYPNFKVVHVKIPNRGEQEKIGLFLAKYDEEIDQQLRKLDLLKDQKKGLMQQLLTGKVRVSV